MGGREPRALGIDEPERADLRRLAEVAIGRRARSLFRRPDGPALLRPRPRELWKRGRMHRLILRCARRLADDAGGLLFNSYSSGVSGRCFNIAAMSVAKAAAGAWTRTRWGCQRIRGVLPCARGARQHDRFVLAGGRTVNVLYLVNHRLAGRSRPHAHAGGRVPRS